MSGTSPNKRFYLVRPNILSTAYQFILITFKSPSPQSNIPTPIITKNTQSPAWKEWTRQNQLRRRLFHKALASSRRLTYVPCVVSLACPPNKKEVASPHITYLPQNNGRLPLWLSHSHPDANNDVRWCMWVTRLSSSCYTPRSSTTGSFRGLARARCHNDEEHLCDVCVYTCRICVCMCGVMRSHVTPRPGLYVHTRVEKRGATLDAARTMPIAGPQHWLCRISFFLCALAWQAAFVPCVCCAFNGVHDY